MSLKSPLGSPNNVAASIRKKVSFKEESSSKSPGQGGCSRNVTTAIDMSQFMTSPHEPVKYGSQSETGNDHIVTSTPASFATDPSQGRRKSETVSTVINMSPFMTSPRELVETAHQDRNDHTVISPYARFATNMYQGRGQSEIVTSKFGTSAPMSPQKNGCQLAEGARFSTSAGNAISSNHGYSHGSQRKIVTSVSSSMTPPDDNYGPQYNGPYATEGEQIDTIDASASPTLAYNLGDATDIHQIYNRTKKLEKLEKFILFIVFVVFLLVVVVLCLLVAILTKLY